MQGRNALHPADKVIIVLFPFHVVACCAARYTVPRNVALGTIHSVYPMRWDGRLPAPAPGTQCAVVVWWLPAVVAGLEDKRLHIRRVQRTLFGTGCPEH